MHQRRVGLVTLQATTAGGSGAVTAAATPVFSPAPGSYSGQTSVSLSSATPGAPATPRSGSAPRLNESSLAMDVYEAGRPSEAEACRFGDARFLNED